MCTGSSTAGSSPGHTSKTSVSVATAATSWSWSHSTAVVASPGVGWEKRTGSPWRRKCICPVRTSSTSPGSAVTPAAASAASRSSPAIGWPSSKWSTPWSRATSASRPRVTIGPNVSMPSRWAPAASHDPGVDAVVQPAVVADVGEGVPVGGGLHAHGHGVVAGAEVGRVAGVGGVDREHRSGGGSPGRGRRRSGARARRTGWRARTPGRRGRRRRPGSTAAASIRLSVPRSSSAPHRPALDTRAASSLRWSGSAMALLLDDGAERVLVRLAARGAGQPADRRPEGASSSVMQVLWGLTV